MCLRNSLISQQEFLLAKINFELLNRIEISVKFIFDQIS